LTGGKAAKAKTAALLRSIIEGVGDPAKVRADAAKMRADMAAHKAPTGPLDIKLGAGGLVDLEFAVHVTQLIHHIGFDPRLEVAIAALADGGLIDELADPDLRLLSRILVTSRLVTPGGGVPEPESRALVAEVCGHADWTSLLEAHDAARQRIARRWAEVKEAT
ncbi:MAG: glutamine-synthetase adenylyltransferase, partial [Sphingomicrobium sp.]